MSNVDNKQLLSIVDDLLYVINELTVDEHIEHAGGECDFMETETFCSRHCESCGCIGAKVSRAQRALTDADFKGLVFHAEKGSM